MKRPRSVFLAAAGGIGGDLHVAGEAFAPEGDQVVRDHREPVG